MKKHLFLLLLALVGSSISLLAGSFVGFESTSTNKLSTQIHSGGLVQNMNNISLIVTSTAPYKYNINLINGGTGTFTMGGITFSYTNSNSYTNSEAGKTAYKTYDNYIQPAGKDREITIPTENGEQVKIVLMESCDGILVNGISQNFFVGDNILTATGSSIVLKNTGANPKISAILSFTPDSDNYEHVQIGNFYYNLDATNHTAEVASQNSTNTITTANIPASVTYNSVTYSVTSIGESAFYGCRGLASVTIPNSVTSIGEKAFEGCTGLTSITIPNSVTSIGDYAFNLCNSLPVIDNVRYADTYLVKAVDYTLASYTIKEGTRFIGSDAFYACSNLTSVVIPSSVTSIGASAFGDCTGLTSVTIPNSVTSIGEWAFSGCAGLTSVTIPNSVTSIGGGAFGECTGLTSITIPNSVTSIEYSAFSGCSGLTSVTIPNSVTYIGWDAFEGCTGLTSVTIEAEIPPTLGSGAFYNTNNYPIYVPCGTLDTYKSVWSYYASRITHSPSSTCIYTISTTSADPERGSTYGDTTALYLYEVEISAISNYGYHFVNWNDNITTNPRTISVTGDKTYTAFFAKNVYSITKNAVHGSISGESSAEYLDKVTLIVVPDRGYQFTQWADGNTENPRTIKLSQDTTMEAICDYLLTGKCGKDNALTWTFEPVSMALDITGKGALSENYTYGTFIESLTIGNEITSIGQSAFYGCINLKNVILGSSVKILEEGAFAGCSATETITCYSQRPPTVNNDALYGLDYSTIVYVPADYLETYKMHDAWGLYDVRPLGAKSTETTDLNVTPAENTADVAWPAVSGAVTYELVIKDKDGNVICKLIFNANGQLTQIAFHAPSHNNAPQQTQQAGFSFTVTGLESGTSYDLTMTSKDSNGQVVDKKEVSFHTNWPNEIENVHVDSIESAKILRDGQIFILRGDKTYTLTGTEVK